MRSTSSSRRCRCGSSRSASARWPSTGPRRSATRSRRPSCRCRRARASRSRVRAGRPVLLVIGPDVPVQPVWPDSKPPLVSDPPVRRRASCRRRSRCRPATEMALKAFSTAVHSALAGAVEVLGRLDGAGAGRRVVARRGEVGRERAVPDLLRLDVADAGEGRAVARGAVVADAVDRLGAGALGGQVVPVVERAGGVVRVEAAERRAPAVASRRRPCSACPCSAAACRCR